MHVTYLVPASSAETLDRRLAGLQKAARSLDLAFEYQTLERHVLLAPLDWKKRHDGVREVGRVGTRRLGYPPGTCHDDSSVGALRHLGDGQTLFAAVPGEKVPERFRDADPHQCDQPWKYARLAQQLTELAEDVSTWSFGLGREVYSLDVVLAKTAATVEAYGWISCAAAETSFPPKQSTADNVLGQLSRPHPKDPDPEERHQAAARAARDWALNLETGSDNYLGNLSVLARHGWVEPRSMGLAVSLIPAFQRAFRRGRESKAAPCAPTLPKPGDRTQFELEVTQWTPTRGHYGVSHCYSFLTREGLRMTWFASSRQELELGDRVVLKGTVKKVDSFRGKPCVYLSRCKVVSRERAIENSIHLNC